MASFVFDPVHDLTQCVPPSGRILGEFDPGAAGPGEHQLVFWCTARDEKIAGTTATSADGGPVAVEADHSHQHSGAGTFQCNIEVRINGASRMPVPKCLAV